MFSSISTMIWGEGEQEGPAPAATSTTTTVRARTPSPSGDDWVLVGASSPAPGDLGALEPLRPGTDSSPPSSAASDVGEEAEPQPGVVTRYGDVRPRVVDRTHPSPADALALEEAKSIKSAQLIKQRNSGKTLSSKALKRSNKTVHAESGKRQSSARINFSIKMAGNRNLKQC